MTTLLPNSIAKQLPMIGATEGSRDPVAVVKFFTPDGSWTWYAVEFDGVDTFYGLIDGHEREIGYFSLRELLAVRGHLGLPVERDSYFEPKPVSDL